MVQKLTAWCLVCACVSMRYFLIHTETNAFTSQWDAGVVCERRRWGKRKTRIWTWLWVVCVSLKIKRQNLAHVIFTLHSCHQRNMLPKCGRAMCWLLCLEQKKCSWVHYYLNNIYANAQMIQRIFIWLWFDSVWFGKEIWCFTILSIFILVLVVVLISIFFLNCSSFIGTNYAFWCDFITLF